jgi:hypothetical protein
MSVYAGADNYPSTTTNPDPGKPATAPSVTDPLEDTQDRTTFLVKRMAAHAEAQHPLEIESTDGTSVKISPVNGLVVFDTMPRFIITTGVTTLTSANIDGGGPAVGSSTYYLYAYWDAGPKFQLSVTVPDQWKLYKSTGTAHALIGIVQTDSAAKWIKHRQSRHRIHYLEPPRVRSPIAAPLGDTIDLSTRLPPEARGVALDVNGITNVSVGSALRPFVAIGPDGIDPLKFRELLLPTGIANSRVNESVEIPLPASRIVSFQTFASTCTLEAYMKSMWW